MYAEKSIRIDKYLSEVTDYSRSLIQKMINDGYVTVNNRVVKSNYILKINDLIDIKDGFVKEMDVLPENMKMII